MRRTLSLCMLMGCAWTQDDWVQQRNLALCRIQTTCFDQFPSLAECAAAHQAFTEPDCPDFDVDAAWGCVRVLEAQAEACPTSEDAWQVPARCADVCGG